jgi:trigger factor
MSTDLEMASTAPEKSMQLQVQIEDKGSCRKHIAVTVSAADIAEIRDAAISEVGIKAQIPGFRPGKAPASLLRKKFREEIEADVKQKVLLASLEQISRDYSIEPIGEPRLNVDDLVVPENGDFSYQFDVEVRPTFDLPDFTTFTITRPAGDPTPEDVEACLENFLSSHADYVTTEEPAGPGDFILCQITFTHNDKVIRELQSEPVRILPTLHFPDAVLDGFSDLMQGVRVGDSREVAVTISLEAPIVEMRGETVHARFDVAEVKKYVLPDINSEFLSKVGFDSEEEFRSEIASSVQRQLTFRQRQETRRQLLEQISATANWELPEGLVRQQVENASRREVLEMAQAGFTRDQILARQNQIQQNAIENTRAALKQHFILDRIATENNIDASQQDLDTEISAIARQRGDSVRRVRANMVKSGMIENLAAQLRERNAVDFLLQQVKFVDVPHKPLARNDQAFIRHAICGNMQSSLLDDSADNQDSM